MPKAFNRFHFIHISHNLSHIGTTEHVFMCAQMTRVFFNKNAYVFCNLFGSEQLSDFHFELSTLLMLFYFILFFYSPNFVIAIMSRKLNRRCAKLLFVSHEFNVLFQFGVALYFVLNSFFVVVTLIVCLCVALSFEIAYHLRIKILFTLFVRVTLS